MGGLFLAAGLAAAAADAPIPSVAEARRVTLEECVTSVLGEGTSVRVAELDTRAAGLREAAGYVAFLPRASVSASRDRDVTFGPPRMESTPQALTASLTWNVIGGGESLGVVQAAHERRRARADERIERRRVAIEVISAYLTIRRNEALHKARQRDLERRSANRDRARELVERGKRPRVEELAAAAEYDAARSSLAAAEFDLRSAVAELRSLLGWSVADRFALSDPPAVEREAPDPAGLPGLVARAWQERPERISVDAAAAALRAGYRRTVESAFPRLDVSAAQNWAWERDPARTRRQAMTVGLTASFSATGALTAAILAAEQKTRLRQSEARAEEMRRRVALDVERAVYGLRSARALREAAESGLASAREAADAVADRYRLGQAQIVELKDAEARLSQAESDAVSGRTRTQLSVQQLAHALGEPLPYAGAAAAEEPEER